MGAKCRWGLFRGIGVGASVGRPAKSGFCRRGVVGAIFAESVWVPPLGGRQKAWFLPARCRWGHFRGIGMGASVGRPANSVVFAGEGPLGALSRDRAGGLPGA